MKKQSIFKIVSVALAIVLAACVLTACGAKAVTVTVKDMGSDTRIEATTAMTVAEALKSGGITLAEKDETEPAKDAKITEDVKEILIKRYAKVTVVYGEEKKEVELCGGTVEDAVKAAAFKLEEGVTPDADAAAYLKDGMTITLVKGTAVTLTADGKTTDVVTKAATVEELIKEQNITLGKDDEVSEKLDAAVTDGMKITVKRVEYKEEKKTESIDFETEEKYSDSMASGTSEVTREGVKGEQEVTYKVKYVDGKEDSREAVDKKVTKEPVNKVVTYGTYTAPEENQNTGSERTVVSKTAMPNCDDESHGYYIINYSDGSVEYEEY